MKRIILMTLIAALAIAPAQPALAKTYSAKQFKRVGVIKYHGYKWTWYSQKVLPGRGLKIPGRHVDKSGYVCDKNNYIVLAHKTMKKGAIVKTPLGKKGKVYDRCPTGGIVDVYVSW